MTAPLLLSQLLARLPVYCSQPADPALTGISTDSRSLQPGNLFVALSGPNFDGHDFIATAITRGAAAVVVSRLLDEVAVPQLVVPDTHLALGALATCWRDVSNATRIAVTGSAGKTTVKEMIAAILRTQGDTLATAGNLNNEIGVPLMLARLSPAHRYGVFEMGANHRGEIAWLTQLVRPHVALVNNAGDAHLEGFGSRAGVAQAKGEIYGGLMPGGTAVINGDDWYAAYWRALSAHQAQLVYGLERGDVHAAQIQVNDEGRCAFDLHVCGQQRKLCLPLLGLHNVGNALAAAAAAHAAGVNLDGIVDGLEAMQPVQGRLCLSLPRAGLRIIDDSYNANPTAMMAAIDVLLTLPGPRVLVAGHMAELGAAAQEGHQRVGSHAAARGVDALFVVGEAARPLAVAAGSRARWFADKAGLQAALFAWLQKQPQASVLVKGSRSAGMESVVHAITDYFSVSTGDAGCGGTH